jgi:hypothetical protein
MALQGRTRCVIPGSTRYVTRHSFVTATCPHFLPKLTKSHLCVDLQHCGNSSVWVRFRYAWGQKLYADGTAAPHIPVQGLAYRPIPPHLGGQTPPLDPFGPYGKYPQVHYYPTAECARQWVDWRAMERARLEFEPRPDRAPWQ